MNNKNVVVVGGSGFLGSHVADALTDSGYDVTIFDQVESKYLRPNQKMITGNLLDKEKVNDAIIGADVVYNFAAIADLDEALEKPIDSVLINILGNVNLLEACRINSVKRYMYASTVYVESREGGFYKCSKLAAEKYVEEYKKSYNLDFTILRYGSLYGPRSDEHNGLWRIVKRAIINKEIKYEGHVDSVREYIHVEDAAKGSVFALSKDFKNETIVLTGQEPMRVLDILKMLAEILGIEKEVNFENKEYSGHYIRTPYAYQKKVGRKYIPSTHVDLGQGLLQLIDLFNS
jgi:UDP-glucose 4-epimerase